MSEFPFECQSTDFILQGLYRFGKPEKDCWPCLSHAIECTFASSGLLFFHFVFLDLLTVSETAHDVVFDEGNGINSPTNLGLEATFINQNFSQQCLKRGPEKRVFPNPNPFVTDDDEGQVASVAYRYEDAQTNVSKLLI